MCESNGLKKIMVYPILLFLTTIPGCITFWNETGKVTADFIFYPQNPTTNDIIQFIDQSFSTAGDIVSWYWDFDIDSPNIGYKSQLCAPTSNLQNPTHRYPYGCGKTFKVKLTVTDEKGNKGSIIKNVTIVPQTYVPEKDDISLKILDYYTKDCDLKGKKTPSILEEFTYIKVQLINNWDKPIVPLEIWSDNFVLFPVFSQNYYFPYEMTPDGPEKIEPGESFTWLIIFLTDIGDVCGSSGKIVFYYLYNTTPEKTGGELKFFATYP